MTSTTNLRAFRRRDLVMIAAAIVGSAIVLGLAVPHEVWAAAGSSAGAGGGAGGPAGANPIEASKHFHDNGLSSQKQVGAVIFGVLAAWGLARASAGGKIGQGLTQAAIASVGFAVCAGPEQVMNTVGSWGTALFT